MAQEFNIYTSQYTAEQIEGFIASGKVRINPSNLHWELWDIATQAWQDTGIVSEGRTTGASWGDITGSLANQSDLANALGNKSNNLMSSNRNLLDNPWFSVNQRGQSSYSGNNYSLDRWLAYAGDINVTVNSGYINLTNINSSNTRRYLQKFETNYLAGKVCTASLMLNDGTIYTGTKTISPDSATTFFTFDNGSDVSTNYINGLLECQITLKANGSYDVKAVKLELGSISTLANDVAPDKETEKIKCMGSKADSSDTYANGCDMGGLRFAIVSTWS